MGLIHILTATALAVNVFLAVFVLAKMSKWRKVDLHSLRAEIKDDMASHTKALKDHQQQLDRQHEKLARLWANVFAPNRVRPAPFPATAADPAPGFVDRSRVDPRKPGDRRSTARADALRPSVLAKMPPADMPAIEDYNPIFGADFGDAQDKTAYVAWAIQEGKMKTVGGFDDKDYGVKDKIVETDDGGWALAPEPTAEAPSASQPAPPPAYEPPPPPAPDFPATTFVPFDSPPPPPCDTGPSNFDCGSPL